MIEDNMEKYSSAVTLSDMEMFVFPELMYSLVLANIMSPILWKWRDEDTFKKLEGKSPYRRLMRMRQYIMDEYDFNLDLETWGLTHKDVEMERFKPYISPEDIARSNALFGYHGDKYYFDVDIRRHFGLDKYDTETIPYWKTETLEAMDAFPFRPDYSRKAGECVSLAALYAAAAFVVCDVPLEDIFMVLTPLHSQNYIDLQDGILTNNRRVVTKAMWFNGTEITAKAQRALRNEQVTLVAHCSGWVHCFYEKATIEAAEYRRLVERLGSFLKTGLDPLTFANFLRSRSTYQRYFIFCHHVRGQERFVRAETLFSYEHDSDFRVADSTFEKLFDEVSEYDFEMFKLPGRVCFEHLNRQMQKAGIDMTTSQGRKTFADYLRPYIPESDQLADDIGSFITMEPRLPSIEKDYIPSPRIELRVGMSRDEITDYLRSIRSQNMTADLAFYALRDMTSCSWEPFIKAAVERNPVSIRAAGNMDIQQAFEWLDALHGESIYEGQRLAQPDEVANYLRGDGAEKAFTLANIIVSRHSDAQVQLDIAEDRATVRANGQQYSFASRKGLTKSISLAGGIITA